MLAGLEPRVPAARPLEGVRLGVLTNYVTDGVEPAVAAAIDTRAQASRSGRGDCQRSALRAARPSAGDQPLRLFADRGVCVASSVAGKASRTIRSARAGAHSEGPARERRRLSRPARRSATQCSPKPPAPLWQRFDAVVAPTVPVVPPRVAELVSDDDLFGRTNALILRNPGVFNFLDACAVAAVPPARRRAGRPDAGWRAARRRRAARHRPRRRGSAQRDSLTRACGIEARLSAWRRGAGVRARIAGTCSFFADRRP